MNWKKLYDTLYLEGYHSKELNIGSDLVKFVVDVYGDDFDSILDIGCSQGLAVKKYQELGKDAYGVDISEVAIKKSKELGIENCFNSSIIKTPFKDKQFDAVVSTDVLEHLGPEQISKAVKEILRITKKYLFLKISKGPEGNIKIIIIWKIFILLYLLKENGLIFLLKVKKQNILVVVKKY